MKKNNITKNTTKNTTNNTTNNTTKKQKKKKKARWLKIWLAILCFILILFLLFASAYFFAKLKKITFTGTKLYTEEELKVSVINDQYCWNTAYVFLKYKFLEPEAVPFIASMKVNIKGIDEIQVQVIEKEIVGYVYVPETGQNAYFDKNGVVVEISSRILEKPAKVEGFVFNEVVLEEKLPVDDTSVFQSLLSLGNILKKYKITPDAITIKGNGDFTLQYEMTSILFGDTKHLNEKILTFVQIMPNIKGMKGILHMEDWKNSDSNVTFEKQE